MENKKLRFVLVEIAMLFLQIVLSKINLFDFLSPVGLPFALVRICFGSNLLLVTIEYAISRIFFMTSLNSIFIVAYQIVIISLFYFVKEFSKSIKASVLLYVFACISNILGFYFSLKSTQTLLLFAIDFLFQMLFVFYFYKLFETYKKKLLFFRFSHGDYVVFSIFSLLLSLGIFSLTYGLLFLDLFILALFTLIFVRVLPPEKFLIFSCLMGLGSSFVSINYVYLIFTIVLAVFLIEFKDYNKWIFSLCSFFVLASFVLLCRWFDVAVIILLSLAVLINLIVPSKWIVFFSKFFDMNAYTMIYNYLESRKSLEIKAKLQLMSNTFLSMHQNFKNLIVGKISREKACEELSGDIISKCCSNCENFKCCFMENINKRAMFENLMSKALANKQVAEGDLSNGLQAYCAKSSIVINEINQTAKLFFSYENAMKNEDASKLIISDELKNFSDIFLNFSGLIDKGLKTNERLSKTIKERLLNALIDVKEVVILESRYGIDSVNVIASNEQVLKVEMTDIISRTTKNNLKIKEIKHINVSGLSLVSFVPMPKLRVSFSVSSKAKDRQNGDNVIVTKLSDTKYFVALADGMGHGEQAGRISSMVLSLIKSMFEVGLDDSLIVSSVNKLLVPAGLDNFTTLDACVIDLDKGECEFIKLGSSVSVLKHKVSSEVVASESLPIGIVKNISPTIIKKNIQAGDAIFIASDGVVDSFPSIEAYKCFINDAKIFNMQKYLDDVISDSEGMSKHADDMTIIAVNVLKNY